jgi:hypothetical protein
MRVWVPDRPGALGAVASRVGAVRGDVVGIDILERGAGRAIDELIIELPNEGLVGLLAAEVSEVDGVDVEHIRPAPGHVADPRLDGLESALVLVRQPSVEALLSALADQAMANFSGDWASVMDIEGSVPLATIGRAPSVAWLGAFVAGSRATAPSVSGPDDVAWANMDLAGLVLVLGRPDSPLRARERRQLTVLASIADSRWCELVGAKGHRADVSSTEWQLTRR